MGSLSVSTSHSTNALVRPVSSLRCLAASALLFVVIAGFFERLYKESGNLIGASSMLPLAHRYRECFSMRCEFGS
jgi:hypothetical protein